MNTLKIKWSNIFLFKGSAPYLVVTLLCLITSAILGFYLPRMIAELGRTYSDGTLFYATLKNLGLLFLGIYINRVGYQLAINKYIEYLSAFVRNLCFSEWVRSYELVTEDNSKKKDKDKYPLGEVISRIINDTEALRELVTSGTFGILIELFFVISCLVGFIQMNKTTGWGMTIFLVLTTGALIWGSKYMRTIFLKVRNSRGDLSRTVANVVGGVNETYYLNHFRYASRKSAKAFDDFLHKILISNIWDASYYSVAESLYPLLLLFIVIIFPYSNITEAAIILALVDLVQRAIKPVKNISSQVANIQRAYSGIIRIEEFVGDLQRNWQSPKITDAIVKVAQSFEKLEVSIPYFKYPNGDFFIKDINFEAKQGSLVGIIGLSGSGKSTVLKILSGEMLPDKFEISIHSNDVALAYNGKNVDSLEKYRRNISLVAQDSHIFSETLFFNITFSMVRPDDFDEFWSWITNHIPYLKSWEISPETKLDQNTLSLGQKQLVAAIRACYLKRSVVLFDEISSALDSSLEEALRNVVLLLQEHSLTIIVAHRIETLVAADQIIIMDKGLMKGRGTHSELVNENKLYQEFLKELSHS